MLPFGALYILPTRDEMCLRNKSIQFVNQTLHLPLNADFFCMSSWMPYKKKTGIKNTCQLVWSDAEIKAVWAGDIKK